MFKVLLKSLRNIYSLKYRYLIIYGILIILVDRVIKISILASGDFYTKNSGIAFGLGKNVPGILFFLIVLGIVILIYLSRQLNLNKVANQVALSMILAGGISNILDRIFYGYVIDYINIFSLSAFNLADLSIVIGSIIILKNYLLLPEVEKGK